MTKEKVPTHITGIAGEYAVAAELSKRGWIASLTMKNTKGVDILICDENAERTLAIQVKTSQKNNKSWVLGKKNESMITNNFFYILVNLRNNDGRTEFHIVPSKIVAEQITKSHSEWLNTPGKKGQAHKDSDMRIFWDANDDYLEKWELLN
jgi:hypothetical protein